MNTKQLFTNNSKEFFMNFSNTKRRLLSFCLALSALLFVGNANATDISGSISSDMILTAADSPYNLTGTVTVDVGVTLTIEPGVTLEFPDRNKNLDVFGTLVALGTSTDHILFTSANANGGGSVGIRENGFADIEYADFENLGTSSLSFYDTGLYLYESTVTADHLTFSNCGQLGGTNHMIVDASSISNFGTNNQLEQVTFINNSLDATATWPNLDPSGFNYRITADQIVGVGTSLTISPGVEIDITAYQADIEVYGNLIAEGTSAEPIRLYSTAVNGGGSLAIREAASADLLYINFEELGRFSLSFYDAGIYIYDNTTTTGDWLTFTNCGYEGGTVSIYADANELSDFGPNNSVDQVALISNSLNETATWPLLDASGFNYRFEGDQFVIDGTTLTIEAGVHVDFTVYQRDLEVQSGGTLIMLGTVDSHINIYSNEVNGGGSVALNNGAIGQIEYVDFADLGRFSLSFFDAGLYIEDVDLDADFMTFTNCGWEGLTSIEANPDYVDGIGTNNDVERVALRNRLTTRDATWPLIDPVDFYYELEGDVHVDVPYELTIVPGVEVNFPGHTRDLEIFGALTANGTEADPIRFYSDAVNGGGSVALWDNSSADINHANFEDLGRFSLSFFDAGIYIYDAALTADNLSFSNCGVANERSVDALPFGVDNIGPNNSIDKIRLRGGGIGKNSVWPNVDPNGFSYEFVQDIWVDAGFELSVEPGVVVETNNLSADLEVYGTFKAVGTPDDKIRFTSFSGNGGGSLVMRTGSVDSEIKHCMIDSLGQSSLSFWEAGIYVQSGDVAIEKNTITQGLNGLWIESGQPLIQNNIIKDNSQFGIRNNSSNGDVTACENYWGDPTGPFNATNNPGGLGNAISDNVIAADCAADALKIVCPNDTTLFVTDDYSTNEVGFVEVCIQDCTVDLTIDFVDSEEDPQCTFDMTRMYTVTDTCGNMKTCNQVINFTDNVDPTIECPADEDLGCNGELTAVDFDAIVADDNCEIASLVLDSELENNIGCDYTYTRTLLATDPEGNSASCSYDISVKIDLDAPVLSEMPGDMTVDCMDYPAAPTVTAMDACDGPVTVVFTEEANEDPCVLSIVRTWTATDECGNIATHTQVITGDYGDVVFVGVPANETVECTDLPLSTPVVTASNNCGALTVVLSDVTAGVFCDGTITRTWTASDECGNTADAIQVVTVVKTGCMDPAACNYDIDVSVDNGLCSYATGCDECTGQTDGSGAVVDNPEIGDVCDDGDATTINDEIVSCGLCQGVTVPGCTDETACNYDAAATVDDASCVLAEGCDECDGAGGVTDNPEVGDACDDGDASTIDDVYTACGVCGGTAVPGCTEEGACNYDAAATVDDDSCVYALGCDECDGAGGVTDLPEIGDACDDGDATTINDIYTVCGICDGTTVPGCTEETACNYDASATVDDESCIFALGCDECDGEGGVILNPEIGDACDDGDATTVNDVYTACDLCEGVTVPGCTDDSACNYDASATVDDDSCVFALGCDECDGAGGVTDNPEIGDACDDGDATTLDDVYAACGICGGTAVPGCTDDSACNYDATATVEDDSCEFALGCDECDGAGGVIDNPEIGDSCDDGDATTVNDVYTACDLCEGVTVPGCTDDSACNYDSTATVDDDSCIVPIGCDACNEDGTLDDNPEIGDACDDGDDLTINDTYVDCNECTGILAVCFDPNACNYTSIGVEGSAHPELNERGIPIGNDFCIYAFGCDECSGETDGTGTVIDNPEVGELCDDGDDNTLDDTVQPDCVCAGLTILGCTDPLACNFDIDATQEDDTCIYPTGCDACNEDGTIDDNPEIGDACDDGDDLTINDTYVDCNECAGILAVCFDPNACNYTSFGDEGSAHSELNERGIPIGNDFCIYAFGCDECSGETDGTGIVIDNPEIGDVCDDGDANTVDDVYVDCNLCQGISIFDCPELEANIGDECDDGNDDLFPGTVTEDCQCEPGMEVFDCPELALNIGDACDDGDATTDNDFVNAECLCIGTPAGGCDNDDFAGALTITDGNIWGVPGWDSFDIACATPSVPGCTGENVVNDTWYTFVAEAENQGILARANPSNPNSILMDMAIQVFDSSMNPLGGQTEGECPASRSCFNNYGAGEIERAVPTGLTVGDTYIYRVYDVNSIVNDDFVFLDTKVKTYASHPILDGCDRLVDNAGHTWTIESPINLYNIPPVPVIGARLVLKDLVGNVVSVSSTKDPHAPGGLTFTLADFGIVPDGDYTIHAQNEVKMMANGCVSAFWSQLGPGCAIEIAIGAETSQPLPEFMGINYTVKVNAYPNPNDGDVVFVKGNNISDKAQVLTIQILDLYGKQVFAQQFAQQGSSFNHALTFDNELSPGMYMIRTLVDGQEKVQKLIIQ